MSSEKKTNLWIEHCKAYAKEYGCSYRDAIKNSKASYKPSKNEKEPAPQVEVEIESEPVRKTMRKSKKNILQ
jgi:hypothetical protein